MEERNRQQVQKSADVEVCPGSVLHLNGAAAQANRPISEKKLAANRANAKRSTGPRTAAGKAKAARNSLKHGLCTRYVLRQIPAWAEGRAEFENLNTEIGRQCQPQGGLEELLAEQIAKEMMRYVRIIQQEQEALFTERSFERNRMDLILRYATSNDRQLRRLIRELERVQKARNSDPLSAP